MSEVKQFATIDWHIANYHAEINMNRVLRTKFFLDSTIEGIDKKATDWLVANNICVGNYADTKLYKLGNVYQFIVVYAEVTKE